MACRYAEKQEDGIWFCGMDQDECRFKTPSEKKCYEVYDDGPLAIDGEDDE